MSGAMELADAKLCDVAATSGASPLSAAHDATSPHERPHKQRAGWHIDPPASWMTPDVFLPGGAVALRTAQLQRAHGGRCLTMWRESVNRFANGRVITAGVLEAHNRQTLDHWCFARAAALAQADARYGVQREPEVVKRIAPVPQAPAARSTTSPFAAAKRRVLRGRR